MSKRTKQAVRDEAIHLIELCIARGGNKSYYVVKDDVALRAPISSAGLYLALDAFGAVTRASGCSVDWMMDADIEAAQLLRDGWSPGDPVHPWGAS